jgi:hypothetical protein
LSAMRPERYKALQSARSSDLTDADNNNSEMSHMKIATLRGPAAALAASLLLISNATAFADDDDEGSDGLAATRCTGLPSQAALRSALTLARHQANGGFNLDMWATVVNRDGIVCAVAFTGANRGSQWPGSRVISAQKANTGNAFSLPQLSLSTANLFSAVQRGARSMGCSTAIRSTPRSPTAARRAPSGRRATPWWGIASAA